MLKEVALLFLKLGTIGFGGPAAHIAMMEEEVVRRRRWIDREAFLDLLGATNLIPGPNSTEMAIHLGYTRAGWAGLVVAGVAFIVPAMVIVTALAWAYVRYGTRPEATALLYGIQPVVVAIIVRAIFDLGRSAVKGPLTAAAGLVTFALALSGANEIAVLFAVAAAVMLTKLASFSQRQALAVLASAALPVTSAIATASFSLSALFVSFVKIGSVVFGSGYVLIAFLRSSIVVEQGWLTDRQLLDAVAVGQLTPGPVFTTATFIGYVLGGLPGAVVATAGIFLPSFALVAATRPLLSRIRRSRAAGAFLDGANVASLGLMAAVVVHLARGASVDGASTAIGIVALVVSFATRPNPAWLVAAGAIVGAAWKLASPSP